MALKIVGSSPIVHPIKTGDIFGYLLFLYGFCRMMGVERPLKKQSGGLFLGRERVPLSPDASQRDVDGHNAYIFVANLLRLSYDNLEYKEELTYVL